jgi:hypothetical protein
MRVRVAQKTVGNEGRVALRECGKIGRAGERSRKEAANVRRFAQEFGSRGEMLVSGEGRGQTGKHVGTARLVMDRRARPDALKKRRHADLISAS